jgi:hypothetical protein
MAGYFTPSNPKLDQQYEGDGWMDGWILTAQQLQKRVIYVPSMVGCKR